MAPTKSESRESSVNWRRTPAPHESIFEFEVPTKTSRRATGSEEVNLAIIDEDLSTAPLKLNDSVMMSAQVHEEVIFKPKNESACSNFDWSRITSSLIVAITPGLQKLGKAVVVQITKFGEKLSDVIANGACCGSKDDEKEPNDSLDDRLRRPGHNKQVRPIVPIDEPVEYPMPFDGSPFKMTEAERRASMRMRARKIRTHRQGVVSMVE